MLTLLRRRVFPASIERVWAAWTTPESVQAWWGPPDVEVLQVSMDVRAGGHWEIVHRLSDGSELAIEGTYEEVRVCERLVYTWQIRDRPQERVRVDFMSVADGTEVRVAHSQVPDLPTRESHERGWAACLEGLARHIQA